MAKSHTELAVRDYLKNEVAKRAVELSEALAAARGGALELPTEVKAESLPSLAMACWARGQAVLEDLSRNAPSLKLREKAAQDVVTNAHNLLELIQTQVLVTQAQPQVVQAATTQQPAISREDAIRLYRERQAQAKRRQAAGDDE